MSKTVKITIGIIVGLAAAGILAVAAVLLVRTLVAPGPTPSSASTAPAGPVSDDAWERIAAAGKIVVGTSADYPPYEYLVDEGRIDGFDIALMDEIGRRLGVEVAYRNLAFDALRPALQLNRLDAAIAAISITPERRAFIDFSNVYLVGEDGLLAREDSGIQAVDAVDDLSTLRVGVQRGTVYEDWLQGDLVASGQLPSDNLLIYDRVEDAVRDLREARLDLVVLDAQPAAAFASQGGVQVVGQGLNQQRLAIALPRGTASLKRELDRVLADLYADGTVAQLARQYLGLDELLPTPPPPPTSTPGPASVCFDTLAFVQHLSHDDEDMAAPAAMQPGQPFTKRWRIQNAGTCTWDSGYQLVYGDGNDPAARMAGQPVVIQGQVLPDATYDVEVDLVAPLKPGVFQAYWRLENKGGVTFGERLPVAVQVQAGPTPTPGPTQTPVPGISFSVDQKEITEGECVAFSWQVEEVAEVYFYAEGQRWQDHGVSGDGRQRECPPFTTTYNLRVAWPDDVVDVRQDTIYVAPAPKAPHIDRFTVDPPAQIPLGRCALIRWQVEGDVDRVTITASGGSLWDAAPFKGTEHHCPDIPGPIGYGIYAAGPGGASRRQYNVSVVPPGEVTPQPTPAPGMPAIHAFSVSPDEIKASECVIISWSVGGAALLVQLQRDGVVVMDDAGFSGQQIDCLPDAGSYVYHLEASSPSGASVSLEETVAVR